MNPLFVHTNQTKNTTILQNQFIDQYMASASGEYVKLYLYLLRCAQAEEEISFTTISDLLDHTEKDIKRALAYWERLGLIRLTKNKDGWITDITFLDIPLEKEEEKEKPAPSVSLSKAAVPTKDTSISPTLVHTNREAADVKIVSPEKLAFFKSKEEIQQLFFIAEQYFGRPLDSTEISTFLYFYDSLHFSTDLIEYLMEYCISKGCGNCRYMQKVALSWAKEGITTVAEAKQNIMLSKDYFSILRAFGIRGRAPIDSEIEFMYRWLKEYGLPLDLVAEACHRTINRIHQPQFSYTEKILAAWKENGVKTLEQLKTYDEQQKSKRPASAPSASPSAPSNRFNNFHQRQYDFNKLEKQLLKAGESSATEQTADEKSTESTLDVGLEIPD